MDFQSKKQLKKESRHTAVGQAAEEQEPRAPGSLRDEAEELNSQGIYLIGAIVKSVASSGTKEMVEVKWYGYDDTANSVVELSSLTKEVQEAWHARPHKSPGFTGSNDTALYVCDRPNEHAINTRKYNIFDDPASLDEELKSFYGESEPQCNTRKDNTESFLRTAGNMYAVSNCGIIYLVRELYR